MTLLVWGPVFFSRRPSRTAVKSLSGVYRARKCVAEGSRCLGMLLSLWILGSGKEVLCSRARSSLGKGLSVDAPESAWKREKVFLVTRHVSGSKAFGGTWDGKDFEGRRSREQNLPKSCVWGRSVTRIRGGRVAFPDESFHGGRTSGVFLIFSSTFLSSVAITDLPRATLFGDQISVPTVVRGSLLCFDFTLDAQVLLRNGVDCKRWYTPRW